MDHLRILPAVTSLSSNYLKKKSSVFPLTKLFRQWSRGEERGFVREVEFHFFLEV